MYVKMTIKEASSMEKYVNELTKCGYTMLEATKLCRDFIVDFSLFDLQNFILWIKQSDVEKIQPKSDRA